MSKENIQIKDGKLIIESEKIMKDITDQGIEFKEDGSLNVDEGANIKISVEW